MTTTSKRETLISVLTNTIGYRMSVSSWVAEDELPLRIPVDDETTARALQAARRIVALLEVAGLDVDVLHVQVEDGKLVPGPARLEALLELAELWRVAIAQDPPAFYGSKPVELLKILEG